MKKLICALLLAALLLTPVALAGAISEATMIYEDEDGLQVHQTVSDAALLKELARILRAARENPVSFDGEHTMNCTLACVTETDILDFAVATDGSAFVTDNATDTTYAVDADDMDRLWRVFSDVKAGMGVEAVDAFEDWDEDDEG